MAAARSQHDAAFEVLTRKNALICVPPNGVLTEEIVLAVGDVIGIEHVRAASRMNQKVVVFVSDVRLVHDVVSSGLTTHSGHFVMASPMDVPAIKIIVSNVPPFVSNQQLVSVLSRYGKIVSKISMIPLGCRHDKAKHVMSFRRQLYMVLPDRGEETSLKVSFKIKIDNYDYQVYASSATLTCFLCGAFGHLKRFCPKASCSKCGESGHVDIDCETVNDPQPRLVEEVRPSESNVPAHTVPLHSEDDKDDFVTVSKKRRASAPRDPTSSPKVVVLDTVVPVTEEPHGNEKQDEMVSDNENVFQSVQCGPGPSDSGEVSLGVTEPCVECREVSALGFPETDRNSVAAPCDVPAPTNDQHPVCEAPVEVPDVVVQDGGLETPCHVDESVKQGSQSTTVHHSVPLLDVFAKVQGDIYEPSGRLSGLSASDDDDMEVTDLSQSSSDHLQISPQVIVSFLNETFRQRNVIIHQHFPDLLSFMQTAKCIIRNSKDFGITKPQIHRLRKFITKAGLECSQQLPNPPDTG